MIGNFNSNALAQKSLKMAKKLDLQTVVNLVKIVWECQGFVIKVSNDFEDYRRELLEEQMVNDFGETVKKKLI